MSLPKKFVYLILALWSFLGTFAVIVLTFLSPNLQPGDGVLRFWSITLLVIIGGTVAYLVHLVNNSRLPKGSPRSGWLAALLLFNWVVMPFYFWMYIRTDSPSPSRSHD